MKLWLFVIDSPWPKRSSVSTESALLAYLSQRLADELLVYQNIPCPSHIHSLSTFSNKFSRTTERKIHMEITYYGFE